MRRRELLSALAPFVLAPGLVGGAQASSDRVWLTRFEAECARQGAWVVVGRIVNVHCSPGAWSGRYLVQQEVTYAALETLAGRDHAARMTVAHPLIKGRRLVDPTWPELRADVFQPAARLVLCLRWARGRWELFDSSSARPL